MKLVITASVKDKVVEYTSLFGQRKVSVTQMIDGLGQWGFEIASPIITTFGEIRLLDENRTYRINTSGEIHTPKNQDLGFAIRKNQTLMAISVVEDKLTLMFEGSHENFINDIVDEITFDSLSLAEVFTTGEIIEYENDDRERKPFETYLEWCIRLPDIYPVHLATALAHCYVDENHEIDCNGIGMGEALVLHALSQCAGDPDKKQVLADVANSRLKLIKMLSS